MAGENIILMKQYNNRGGCIGVVFVIGHSSVRHGLQELT